MNKATPLITVDEIEPCLPFWTDALGFELTATVPHGDAVGFAMLNKGSVELMYQSRASVDADLGAFDQLCLEEHRLLERPEEVLVRLRVLERLHVELRARTHDGLGGVALPGCLYQLVQCGATLPELLLQGLEIPVDCVVFAFFHHIVQQQLHGIEGRAQLVCSARSQCGHCQYLVVAQLLLTQPVGFRFLLAQL